MDTFMAYVGVYSNVEDPTADYDAVHDLHTQDVLIDAYDAAVIERKDNGKVKIEAGAAVEDGDLLSVGRCECGHCAGGDVDEPSGVAGVVVDVRVDGLDGCDLAGRS